VYTSKVATECSREEKDTDDNGDNTTQEQGCILHCIETTKLYEENTLISETSNFFKNDCPGDDAGDDGSYIRSIEHTIQDGPPPSSVHTRSIGPEMKEDPHRIVDTSEDEHDLVKISETGNDDGDDYYDDY